MVLLLQVVKADNHSWPVTEFYQKDLEAGRLYFQHRGPDYGRAVIQVQKISRNFCAVGRTVQI